MKDRLGKVLLGLGKAFLAFWVTFTYLGAMSFLAALYTGAGHGNYTPVQLIAMPSGNGPIFFAVAVTLSPFARNRVVAGIGALVLLYYLRGLWMEDFAGTLRRFSFTTLSQAFVAAVYVYLSAVLGLLAYFVFRICVPETANRNRATD